MGQFIGEIRAVGSFMRSPSIEWLPCDGRLVAIEDYSPLFDCIGNVFGGDGVTNFALPDLRGRTPVGVGAGHGLPRVELGQSAGSQQVTLTTEQLPKHTHDASGLISATLGTGTRKSPQDSLFAVVTGDDGTSELYAYATLSRADATLAPNAATVQVQPTGGDEPVDILNPYLGTNFVVAWTGSKDSDQFFTGEIRLMAAQQVLPDQWHPCEGQLLPVSRFGPLLSLIGNTFGGDGVTTFALPDYRGRMLLGMGAGPGMKGIALGEQGGSPNVVLSPEQMPKHLHGAGITVVAAGSPGTELSPANNIPAIVTSEDGSSSLPAYAPVDSANGVLMAGAVKMTVQPKGSSSPLPLTNPNLGIQFIIAIEGGEYPTHS